MSGRSVPATTALTFAPTVAGLATPKSTTALTPIEQLALESWKYPSGQEAAKSRTSRAIGGFGCAALPVVE